NVRAGVADEDIRHRCDLPCPQVNLPPSARTGGSECGYKSGYSTPNSNPLPDRTIAESPRASEGPRAPVSYAVAMPFLVADWNCVINPLPRLRDRPIQPLALHGPVYPESPRTNRART